MKKTHCVRGHEFTPENTYTSKEGWRDCRACRREGMKKKRQTSPETLRKSSREWRLRHLDRLRSDYEASILTPDGLASRMLASCKHRAKIKGIPFAMSKEKILRALHHGVCEATGISFEFAAPKLRETKKGREKSPWSPSIDRKDNSKGYTDDNIQVVVWAFNLAKSSWPMSVLLRLSRAVAGSEPS